MLGCVRVCEMLYKDVLMGGVRESFDGGCRDRVCEDELIVCVRGLCQQPRDSSTYHEPRTFDPLQQTLFTGFLSFFHVFS